MTDKKLERIGISCGDWSAEVLPGYSMNLISLKYRDRQIMRTPENDDAFVRSHIVYGNAFLLPPDRTTGGKFTFEGKTYSLPVNEEKWGNNLHGLMTDADFVVTGSGKSYVSGRYVNEGERYPFKFTCDITVEVAEDGLSETYEFENTGDCSMPLLFGLHTNFASRGYVKVPVEKEYIFDRSTFTPGKEPVELTENGRLLLEGTDPTGKTISNFFVSAGDTAVIDDFEYIASPAFRNWVVWNCGGDKGFISVEPESGPANGLNMEGAFDVIEAGQRIVFTTKIRLAAH